MSVSAVLDQLKRMSDNLDKSRLGCGGLVFFQNNLCSRIRNCMPAVNQQTSAHMLLYSYEYALMGNLVAKCPGDSENDSQELLFRKEYSEKEYFGILRLLFESGFYI